MMNLKDKDIREKIKNELDKTFMVEAGAGAGKTTCLVTRMVNQIKTGRLTIEKIAAITFTKKATKELSERFQRELKNISLDSNLNKEEKIRIDNSLKDINKCFIGTIQSFCGNIIRECPVEANIRVDYTEMDEEEAEKINTRYWYEYIYYVYENNNELIQKLTDNSIDVFDLIHTFECINRNPDIEIADNSSINELIIKSFNRMRPLLEEAYEYAQIESTKKNKWQDLVTNDFNRYNSCITIEDKDDFLRYVKKFCFKQKLDLENENYNTKEIIERLENIRKNIKEISGDYISVSDNLPKYSLSLKFVKEGIEYVNKRRLDDGKLSFQDILTITRNLLKENLECRKYFSNKYEFILVDEFQDTDPLQGEIIFFLTAKFEEEYNWRNLKIKDGALFIVGDPKQSIYRFRNADINFYNKIKERILVCNGEVLKLTTNFRSLDVLCNWFNNEFKNIFPNEPSKYQAEFCEMDSIRKCSNEDLNGVMALEVSSNKNDGISNVCSYIKQLIIDKKTILVKENDKFEIRPVKLSDFMILTRNNEDVNIYKEKFSEIGIECCATGEFKLVTNSLIGGLRNIISFINDNQDIVSLIGSLKLAFGVSDQMLYDAHVLNLNIYNYKNPDMQEMLLSGEYNAIVNAYEKLSTYISWKNSYSPITVLNKIIEDLNIIEILLSTEKGSESINSLFQIIENLRQDKSDINYDFVSMAKTFELLCNSKTNEIISVVNTDINKIRVMSIHKSKGLEAPIVILANHIEKDFQVVSHIDRNANSSKGYYTIFKKGGKRIYTIINKPPMWEDIEIEEKKYEDAEKERLQYVAATRAENMLVIVYDADKKMTSMWNNLLNSNIKYKTYNEILTSSYCEEENLNDNLIIEEIKEFDSSIFNKSYNIVSPTEDEVIGNNVKVDSGGSMEWGTIVHKVFEEYIKGTESINYVMKDLIRNSEKHTGDYDKLKDTLDRFIKSETKTFIDNSIEVYTEIDFSLEIKEDTELYELYKEGMTNNQKIYIRGIIDLLIKNNGEWYIIDYKTDQVNCIDDAKIRAESYRKQQLSYKYAFEKITNNKIKDIYLYFTYLGERIVL